MREYLWYMCNHDLVVISKAFIQEGRITRDGLVKLAQMTADLELCVCVCVCTTELGCTLETTTAF